MAKKEIVLCDTNILIELSKNNLRILEKIEQVSPNRIAISAISAGEFLFGARDKQELVKIKRSLNAINILHTNTDISLLALKLIERYSLSHHLDIPDALIAATAIVNEASLFTLNLKHFRYIEEVKLYDSHP